MDSNKSNFDDSSSGSIQYQSNEAPRRARLRKTIHPSRFAHIQELTTKDQESNIVTIFSIQDYRRSGTYESEDGCPQNDDYLVSYPDDDSDIYSMGTDTAGTSVRNSIYSVKSGQEIFEEEAFSSIRNSIYSVKSEKDIKEEAFSSVGNGICSEKSERDIRAEAYSLIDATLAETIASLNESLEELNAEELRAQNQYAEIVVEDKKDRKINELFVRMKCCDTRNDARLLLNRDYKRSLDRCEIRDRGCGRNEKATDCAEVIVDSDYVSESESKRFKYCFEDGPQNDIECQVVLLKTGRAPSIQRSLKWSGFKKLPEGVELTLGELRAMALRQQQQIDCQHQLLAAREQRLRFLKQQEARHHQVAAENERLRRLRERVEAQELKLRRLRALRGQLDQTNLNNVALTSDLESIRALFNEKEKELSVAVAKVEELTRQLEDVRRGRAPPRAQPPAALELDKLRRELMYRNKLNEQQNARLSQQREALTARQAEMASIDQRISELQGRLQRKRVANRQLATQITGKHHAPRMNNPAPVQLSNYPSGGTGPNVASKTSQVPRGNIAAVEPYNHIPHAPSVNHGHNFQALKHNAAQNNIPMKLVNQTETIGGHLSQQEAHYLQQKQFSNQVFSNGAYPQRLQANLLQMDQQFVQQYPIKQNEINAYQTQQGLANQQVQNDQKILLDHINKYNIDLQKTVNHNHNQNVQQPVQNQQGIINKQRQNEQEFLPEFAASKSDPKYQTLPYNTKFTANGSTKQKGQFYDDSGKSSNEPPAIVKVSSSSNVNNLNHMTAHSTPLTISKGLATPLMPADGYQHEPSGYHLQKSESGSKCNQEEKENMGHTNARVGQSRGGDQMKYKVQEGAGGRADLVRAFSQHTTVTSTGQMKPVSSVAPTSVQVSSGKPSPIYQTSSTKIQPVQPQTVSQSQSQFPKTNAVVASGGQQSLLLSPPQSSSTPLSTPDVSADKFVPKPALPPKPSAKPQSGANDSNSPQQSYHDQLRNAESAIPPVPTTDPPVDPDNPNQNNHQSSSASSTDSQQMIIKARPLTIRKQPLSEQPKLKSLSNNTGKINTVAVATNRRIEMPPSFLFPEMDQTASESSGEMSSKGVDKINGNKLQFSGSNANPNSCDVTDRAVLSPESSETSSEDQPEKNGMLNVADQMNTVDINNANGDCVSRRVKKGNLKQSGKVNLSRRVSFDPLALLLDASLEGELELVKKTATQVANASAANDEGITALHNAICAGHFEIVKFLVEFGCDVNAQDSDGWTPLHCAASCNNVAMVRFLVENGACIFATTLSDHETAAQKCEEDEEGFDGCSEYLYSVQEKLGILNGGAVYAVFPYSAHEPDELSFVAGVRLGVLRKGDDAEREWWWTRTSHGQEGYVPRNLLGLYPRVTPKQDQ